MFDVDDMSVYALCQACAAELARSIKSCHACWHQTVSLHSIARNCGRAVLKPVNEGHLSRQ